MIVRAGTSGYAFKEWKGAFYPKTLPARDMLGYYASKFPTVEINNTFYRLPKENVVLEWASSVPETFAFAVKASQRITHYGRLTKDTYRFVEGLLRIVRLLGPRLGPVLFQLPSNFQKDLERLKGFVDELPRDLRFAMEFRHESWFDEDTFAVLRDHDVAMCVAEQEEFKCPVVSTASWGYLRLHRFDYDDKALGVWADCVAAQPWKDAFVFFKHDEGIGSGPPAVDAFVRALGRMSS